MHHHHHHHDDKETLATFERQFARWKVTQDALTRSTALHINADAAATRRQTMLMIVASLGAVAGMIALIAWVLQHL